MRIRALLRRVERIESFSRSKDSYPPECICFPEGARPCFHWTVEVEIAAKLKCPLHGDRFRPSILIYVSRFQRRKREWFIANRTNAQYQKAWLAGFPPDLWPAEEEEYAHGILLRLKDGTTLVGEEFPWRKS